MAPWFGEDFFTLDNHSLLSAIHMVEGNCPISDVIKTRVLDQAFFEVVRDNDHFRLLLKTFLIADIAFSKVAIEIKDIDRQFWGFLSKKRKKTLEEQRAILKGDRDEAFKKYEMFRKLSAPDNPAMRRIPYF